MAYTGPAGDQAERVSQLRQSRSTAADLHSLQQCVVDLLEQPSSPCLKQLSATRSAELVSALRSSIANLEKANDELAAHSSLNQQPRTVLERNRDVVNILWSGTGCTTVLQLMAIADRELAGDIMAPSPVTCQVHMLCHLLFDCLVAYWKVDQDTCATCSPLIQTAAVRLLAMGQVQLWCGMLAQLAAALGQPPAQVELQHNQDAHLRLMVLSRVIPHAEVLLRSTCHLVKLLLMPSQGPQVVVAALEALAESQLLEHACRLLLLVGPLYADADQAGVLPQVTRAAQSRELLRSSGRSLLGLIQDSVGWTADIASDVMQLLSVQHPSPNQHGRVLETLRRILTGPCLQYYLGARALQAVCALDGGPSWGLRATGLPLPWELGSQGSHEFALFASSQSLPMADLNIHARRMVPEWPLGPEAMVDILCRAAAVIATPPAASAGTQRQQRLLHVRLQRMCLLRPMSCALDLLQSGFNAANCMAPGEASQRRYAQLWRVLLLANERYHSRLPQDAPEVGSVTVLAKQLDAVVEVPRRSQQQQEDCAALRDALGPPGTSLTAALGAGWVPAYEWHLRDDGLAQARARASVKLIPPGQPALRGGMNIDWLRLMAHGDERQVAALIATSRRALAAAATPLATQQQQRRVVWALHSLLHVLNEKGGLLDAWCRLQVLYVETQAWHARFTAWASVSQKVPVMKQELEVADREMESCAARLQLHEGYIEQALRKEQELRQQHVVHGPHSGEHLQRLSELQAFTGSVRQTVQDTQRELEASRRKTLKCRRGLQEAEAMMGEILACGDPVQNWLRDKDLLQLAMYVHCGRDVAGDAAVITSSSAGAPLTDEMVAAGARLAQVERLLVYAAAQWLPALAAAVNSDLNVLLQGGVQLLACGELLPVAVETLLLWVPAVAQQLEAAAPGSEAAASWRALLLRDMRVLQLLEALLQLAVAEPNSGAAAGVLRLQAATLFTDAKRTTWADLDFDGGARAPTLLDLALAVLAALAERPPHVVSAGTSSGRALLLLLDQRLETHQGPWPRAYATMLKAATQNGADAARAAPGTSTGSGPSARAGEDGGPQPRSNVPRMPAPFEVLSLQPTCSFFGCVRLEGRSEAGVALQACGRCGRAHYCCRACQVAHWPVHKPECSARPAHQQPA